MLKIKNISAVSNSELILNEINLEVKPGEIHAIMGPKNSGKSALAHLIAGHPGIMVTEGTMTWKRKKLEELDATKRSHLGIGISFQVVPEFECITNLQLAKNIFNSQKTTIEEFDLKYKKYCSLLDLDFDHGLYSPGIPNPTISRVKKNELLLILLKNPELIILDEIDEGLEESDIILLGSLIKDILNEKNSAIIITHNQSLLKILNPTHVHVIVDGEIRMTGNTELFTRIIEDGYSEFS